MKKFPILTYLLLPSILIIIILSQPSAAYRDEAGIEAGDIVNLNYIGTFENGTQFDQGTIEEAEIRESNWIRGFYLNVLTMKIGETKTFDVPPEQGYTDPSDERTAKFVGHTLRFIVTINALVKNIRGTTAATTNTGNTGVINNPGSDNDGGVFSRLWNIILWVGGFGIAIFAIISFRSVLQKQTTPSCMHCKALGRSQISEGKCGKCGNTYCRNSFSRGCPNCKSNTFIPYSS